MISKRIVMQHAVLVLRQTIDFQKGSVAVLSSLVTSYARIVASKALRHRFYSQSADPLPTLGH